MVNGVEHAERQGAPIHIAANDPIRGTITHELHDAAKLAQEHELTEAVRKVQDLIAKINSDPMISSEDKRKLTGQLQSAITGGNVNLAAINSIISEVNAAQPAAAANTTYEIMGNAAVAQSYQLSAAQLAQVHARSMYVDLNNAQQVQRYAAAWVDPGTPPAVAAHETQEIANFITKTPEGRQAVAIMNAHPAETKQVNTEQAQDVVALQALQKRYAGNRAASEAITSTLNNRLYSHSDMHGEIAALTRDPSRIGHFEQVVHGHEATLRRDLIRKANQPEAQQAHPLTTAPAARMTPEQSVDTYLAVSKDKHRAETAAQIAQDLYKHPSHTSQYNPQQLKDANSWWSNHPAALEQALVETSNTVLSRSNGKAIAAQIAMADDKSHSIAQRGEAIGQIAASGNAYLASLMKSDETKVAMKTASQHVAETGVLDTALHKAATATVTLGGGLHAMLTGDIKKADEYALHAGRGVKRTLDGYIGNDAAQFVGNVATKGFTAGSHVAGVIAHPLDTASSLASNVSSSISGAYAWATGAKPAPHPVAHPAAPNPQNELKAARAGADANHDGKITGAELTGYLAARGMNAKTADLDHNGAISNAELAAASRRKPAAAQQANTSVQSQFEAAEAKLGLDPHQKHSLAEIKKALHDHGVKDADIAKMMADGNLSKGEVINAAAHIPNAKPHGKPAHAH